MPKSDTNALSDLQIKVLHYLSTPGKPERHAFLAHLKANTLVVANRTSEQNVISHLRGAIDRNPTGACRDGIERFKKAFPEVFPNRRKVQILVELEVEGYDDVRPDGRVSQAIAQSLVNAPLEGGGKVVGVQAGDPLGTPSFDKPTRTRKSGSLALIGLRTNRVPRNGLTLRCGCWHYGMAGQSVTVEGERLGGWNSNECPTHGRQPIVKANVPEWDPTPTCEASKAVAADADVM